MIKYISIGIVATAAILSYVVFFALARAAGKESRIKH